MELEGRVALITASRRIGAVVATELARAGGDVALVYRSSRAEAEETAVAVRGQGRRALVLQADLTDPEACDRIVDETVDSLGRLDVLVNIASVYSRKSLSTSDSTTFATSISPPQWPSGVARSTLSNSSSDIPSGATIGPGAIALTRT